MTHANAPLTPEGRRRLAHLVVEEGWPMRRAAERFQVSPATASRWVGRYRAGQPMEDRSCRPHHSPGRLARRTERRVIALRLNRRWGPHRIAYHLGLARSTVGRILARYNMPRLTEVDQATGLAVRRPPPVRYEKTSPPGSWSISTSTSSAASPTAGAGALTDGAQRPLWPRTAPRPAPAVGAARWEAIGTSTTR